MGRRRRGWCLVTWTLETRISVTLLGKAPLLSIALVWEQWSLTCWASHTQSYPLCERAARLTDPGLRRGQHVLRFLQGLVTWPFPEEKLAVWGGGGGDVITGALEMDALKEKHTQKSPIAQNRWTFRVWHHVTQTSQHEAKRIISFYLFTVAEHAHIITM